MKHACLVLALALTATVMAQPVMDGAARDPHYGPTPLAVQDTTTGFGDSSLGLPDRASGSELDAAYAAVYNNTLYLVLAGNFETNGNELELFFDTRPGGQNRLLANNPPLATGLLRMAELPGDPNLPGFTFTPGFEADFHISAEVYGYPTNMYLHYAEIYVDPGNPGVYYYLGEGKTVCETSGGALTSDPNNNPPPWSILATADNSNIFGVGGDGGNPDGSGVLTGIELAIPLAALGNPTGTIGITAFINGQQHDFVSNQFLVGLLGGANLGEPRAVDLGNTWHFPLTVSMTPTVYGACCTGGTCSIVTQAQCAGVWQGAYTSCEGNPCDAAPAGACCLDNSFGRICQYVSAAECTALGGAFTAGIDCSGCPCAVAARGACCTGDVCTPTMTQADCVAGGGAYVGDFSTCADSPCNSGACCDVNVCSVLRHFECNAIQFANYLGDGTTCDNNPCASATIPTPHVAGSMQGWDAGATPMTETAPGSQIWTHTFTGLTPSTRYEFKITNGTWSQNLPSNNSWLYTDASGNVTVTYDGNFYFDGWAPNRDRLGVSASNPNPWIAVGNFLSEIGGSDWNNADPAGVMTAQGGGVYKKTFTGVPAGNYAWKAVVSGSWDSISWDGRSINTQDMTFTVNAATDTVNLYVNELVGVVKVEIVAAPVGCAGDANCDNVVSWRDIDFFIAGLNDNQAAWQALFPPPGPSCPFLPNLDINSDGHVTWRDIDPFIAWLNTTCPH